jgi:hypothetical protein
VLDTVRGGNVKPFVCTSLIFLPCGHRNVWRRRQAYNWQMVQQVMVACEVAHTGHVPSERSWRRVQVHCFGSFCIRRPLLHAHALHALLAGRACL